MGEDPLVDRRRVRHDKSAEARKCDGVEIGLGGGLRRDRVGEGQLFEVARHFEDVQQSLERKLGVTIIDPQGPRIGVA